MGAPSYDAAFWNTRYGEDGWAYGTEPSGFLATHFESVVRPALAGSAPRPLRALCIADGEGRNSIYLAQSGVFSNVTAVDQSEVGMRKLEARAREVGVQDKVVAQVADLAVWDFAADGPWDLIVSVFAHTPPALREKIHLAVAATLAPGGHFLLQSYTPANIGRGTGGPQAPALCCTEATLRAEFALATASGAIRIAHMQESEKAVNEGKYHNGLAAVVEFVAVRTA